MLGSEGEGSVSLSPHPHFVLAEILAGDSPEDDCGSPGATCHGQASLDTERWNKGVQQSRGARPGGENDAGLQYVTQPWRPRHTVPVRLPKVERSYLRRGLRQCSIDGKAVEQ